MADERSYEVTATSRYGVTDINWSSVCLIDLSGLTEADWLRLETDREARGLADWEDYFALILYGKAPEDFLREDELSEPEPF